MVDIQKNFVKQPDHTSQRSNQDFQGWGIWVGLNTENYDQIGKSISTKIKEK